VSEPSDIPFIDELAEINKHKKVLFERNISALADCAARLEQSCLDEKLDVIKRLKQKIKPSYDEVALVFKQYLYKASTE